MHALVSGGKKRRKGSVQCARRWKQVARAKLACDQLQEFCVVFGFRKPGDHRFRGFLDLLLHQGPSEKMDVLEGLRIDQQLLLAGAGFSDVDGRPKTHFSTLAVED